jgi:hypothetical protein
MYKYNYKQLREIDLNIIVAQIFNATEIETKEYYNTRKYLIYPDTKIAITGSKWIDNITKIGGYGALDLLIYINKISILEAAKLLDNLNLTNITSISVIDYKITIPEPCIDTWDIVKLYLTNIRKIPEHIINNLHQKNYTCAIGLFTLPSAKGQYTFFFSSIT